MGGAVGHLQHLHENKDLTFQEIKEILTAASTGRLKNVTEKLDGLNLVFTWCIPEGSLRVARAVGDIKRGGLALDDLRKKFDASPSLKSAFVSSFDLLQSAVGSMSPKTRAEVFGPNGNRWYSVEVVYAADPNVISYDSNNVVLNSNPVFERSNDGSVCMSSDTVGIELLTKNFQSMQKMVSLNGWQLKAPIILTMKELHDKSALRRALEAIDKTADSVALDSKATLREYITSCLEDRYLAASLPLKAKKLVIKRCLAEDGAPTLLDIKKITNNSDYVAINEFVKASPVLIREFVRPIEKAVSQFAVSLLRGLQSTLVKDSDIEINRLRKVVKEAIEKIEASENEAASSILREQMEKLGALENISTTVEGVVFLWKGQTYKFTGSFAQVNQILGLFKYGRGKVPPLAG